MEIWRKQSFFVLMIENLNSKTLHKNIYFSLYFEDVIVSLVTHSKQWSRELNFAYM